MTGRASIYLIASLVVKMLRFIVFSCCVVLSMCAADDFLNCGKNAEIKCVQPCPPQKTCRNRDVQYSCLQVVEPCNNICTCKPGYLRNVVGDCISNEECDMCQRENEYFACGSACDNECATIDTQNKTNCPIKNFVCSRKCYCEDGFARDDKGNCIPVEKCHSKNVEGGMSKLSQDESRVRRTSDLADPICTGEHEVHTDCKKSCPPNTCLSLVARFKCDSNEPCKKGCICKPGYLKQTPTSPCLPICQCTEMKHSADCKSSFITKE